MTDAISSVSSNSVSSASSSSASTLSEETKKKLKALGLDPSKYTTEAQAQAAITQAQAQQQAQQTQQKQGGAGEDTIKTEVQDLASKIGISVGTNDKIDDILSNISDKITELKLIAGSDQSKLSEVNDYQTQYTTISSELEQLEASRNMTGASALANYNKALLMSAA